MDWNKFSKLVMIEQTLFALPFAWLGVLFGGGGSLWQWILVTLALVSARIAGMSFNRVLDAEIDAKNPRTAERLIPAGEVSRGSVWALAVFSSLVLVAASWFLNMLVFYLSFVAVALLFTYSFFKRFSASSHYYLGVVEAAAPIGGYLAIHGAFDVLAFLPGAAIFFWIAGVDILYAIQDLDFDRQEGLHSVPARFGIGGARLFSVASYSMALVSLVAAGFLAGWGVPWYSAVALVALLFGRQQMIAWRAGDEIVAAMGRVFYINRFISPVLLAGAVVEAVKGLI